MPDVANKQTALILGRSLITGETVWQEIRERLVKELAKRRKDIVSVDLVQIARAILEDVAPLFAEHIWNTDLAAWLAGYAWTADKVPSWFDWELSFAGEGPPPPGGIFIGTPLYGDEPIVRFPLIEKAAESLAKRGILTRAEFDAVSEATRLESFTMAGDWTRDTLTTVRDTLAEVTDEGASLEGFRSLLKERIDTSAIGPHRLETVYRTNIQAAFRDGRETLVSNPVVSELFQYQEYFAIHDGRVRDSHLELETLGIDGTGIYRRDDPFWDAWTPPVDFNCRCSVNVLTVDAAARKGVKEAQVWEETGIRPPLVSRLPFIPFAPNPGFGARGRVLVA